MPKNLIPLSVSAPGFYGLNKQKSGDILPPGWATEAKNLVFDEVGRLSSRKGYKHLNASAIAGTPDVRAIHQYIDTGGQSIIILAAGNAIYKVSGTSLVDISGTITTPTGDNWKFQNFNGKCVGYQAGHAPIELTTVSGSFTDAGGTQYNGTDVLAAYGRLWTIYNNTLYYSDLLINSYAGGSSGSFDLAAYWKGGMDEAVAVADFNGYLVVFGKSNIIVYDSPDDPTASMSIVENISGTGCIARDSIQNVGTDLLFLSNSGIQSLGRVIQEKSMPLRDVSKYIKSDLHDATAGDTSKISSAYNTQEGFYLLSLPDGNKSYVLDLKFPLQDGSLRATEWDYAPTSCYYSNADALYLGNGGYVSTYTGYKDSVLYDGTGGSLFRVVWEGPWLDFGDEVSSLLKIPKKMTVLLGGVQGRIVSLKWGFDYEDVFNTASITFPPKTKALYSVAQYSVDSYSGSLEFDKAKSPLNKSGQVIKFGIEVDVNGTQFIIQRIDMLVKVGRIAV